MARATTRVRGDGKEVKAAAQPTPEIARRMYNMLARGMTLTRMCEQDDMPDLRTVYNWMYARDAQTGAARYPHIIQAIEKGRRDGTDALIDQTLDIADRRGTKTVQRDKLQIDTRLKVAEKRAPDRWGQRTQHDVHHTGSIDHNLSPREVARKVLDMLNRGELERADLGLPALEEIEDAEVIEQEEGDEQT